METVKDIRRRATRDLRRRIFENGVFQRQRIQEMARSLSRKHASGLSPEKLLALARHDSWLKSGRGGPPPSQYPGEKTSRIAEELLCYLRCELGLIIDTFWEGRTSVELIAKRSSVELAGFFNGEQPSRKDATEGLRNGAHNPQPAPYA